jgi:hypothetical protein
MLFFNQSKFLFLSFLLAFALNTSAPAMEDEAEESGAHFVILKNNLKDLKAEREDPLFYVIPLNAPIFYFGFLQNLLIQGVDYCTNPASLVRALSKKESPKETIIFTPKLSYDLHQCILEYKMLHMTRREFIETQTNPPFYSIFYKKRPLYVFILPTVHSLPLEALPTNIRKVILAIAKTPGSKLIMEIGDDFDNEGEDETPALLDPRMKLNIEAYIQSNLKLFEIFYETSPKLKKLSEILEEGEKELRSTLEQGWTKKLDSESLKKLSHLVKLRCLKIEDFNQIDPFYFFYNLVVQLRSDHNSSEKQAEALQLDDQIEDIFSEYNRPIQGLENRKDRNEAMPEDDFADYALLSAAMSSSSLPFYHLLYYLQEALKNLSPIEEDNEKTVSYYIPTLNDLDFSNMCQMLYLRDAPPPECFCPSDCIRNTKWWNRTIKPLLKGRVESQVSQHSFPILMTYGAGHNEGSFSIIDLIRKEDFEVRKFNQRTMRF